MGFCLQNVRTIFVLSMFRLSSCCLLLVASFSTILHTLQSNSW